MKYKVLRRVCEKAWWHRFRLLNAMVLLALFLRVAYGLISYHLNNSTAKGTAASVSVTFDGDAKLLEQKGALEQSNLFLECAEGGPCRVVLKRSAHADFTVFDCESDGMRTRDEILNRLSAQSPPAPNVAIGAMDAFLHSSLRRLCTASATAGPEERVPFNFEKDKWFGRVVGVWGELLGATAGLARRPFYSGDVVAAGRPPPAGAPSARLRVELRRPGATDPLITFRLVGAGAGYCTLSLSESPTRVEGDDCGTVRVNDEMGDDLLTFFVTTMGDIIVNLPPRRPAMSILSNGMDVTMQQQLFLRKPQSQTSSIEFVPELASRIRPLRLRFTGDETKLSRAMIVNDRWARWTLRGDAGIAEAATRWLEQTAKIEKLKNAFAATALMLDYDAHRALERGLADFMRAEEPETRQHQLHKESDCPERETKGGGHRRPVTYAGITVMDVATGGILAAASYPPEDAVVGHDHALDLSPAWENRLVASAAEADAVGADRRTLVEVRHRVVSALGSHFGGHANANFIPHVIGSTFKPILLSLAIDQQVNDTSTTPRAVLPPDGLDQLFDLVVAGHVSRQTWDKSWSNAAGVCSEHCRSPEAEYILGFPFGPFGNDAGVGHRELPLLGRWEFLIGSCNKYALAFGFAGLLDWSAPRRAVGGHPCCFARERDRFLFRAVQPLGLAGQSSRAAAQTLLTTLSSSHVGVDAQDGFPPESSGLVYDSSRVERLRANPTALGSVPLFKRLRALYDLEMASSSIPFDAGVWSDCAGALREDLNKVANGGQTLGGPLRTSLNFDRLNPTSFSNIFTGANINVWTNTKLAEAYARLTSNNVVTARFCRPAGATTLEPLFVDGNRHRELAQILSQQRHAGWVRENLGVRPSALESYPPGSVKRWLADAPSPEGTPERVMLSKTGTSRRSEHQQNTDVFVAVFGRPSGWTTTGVPAGPHRVASLIAVPLDEAVVVNGRVQLPHGIQSGIVVVAHLDTAGGTSEKAVRLVNVLFPVLSGMVP